MTRRLHRTATRIDKLRADTPIELQPVDKTSRRYACDPDNYHANTPTEEQPFLTKTKLHTLQKTTSAETDTSAAMSEVD